MDAHVMKSYPRFYSLAVLVVASVIGAGEASAASRYASLLASTAGQDTLRNLALFEDQRVTGEGMIFEYLAEGSPLVRLRVIEALGRMQDPSDATRLIPLITAKNRMLAREAIFALGQIGNREAVAPLVKARAGASPDDLGMIAEALGKLGGDDAVAALTEMLHDFSASVRAQAALALARCKHPEAANALLLSIHDPDTEVEWRAIYSLEKQDVLPRTCSSLVDFLENSSPPVRASAARTLGKLKCTEAAKALERCLGDAEVRVVVNAARALGEIPAKDAGPALGKVLRSHGSPHARAQAAMALEQIGDKNARDALTQGLLDPSAMVRIHSVRAMAVVLTNKSEMFIDQMRGDGNRLVRAEAIECYGRAGLSDRAKELGKIARDDKDPMMRVAAIKSLGRFKDPSIPVQLVPYMLDPDFTVAASAVEAVGALNYRAAIPQLIDAYYTAGEREFVDVELEVVRVLGDLNALEADTLMVHAMGHPDVRVRTLASETLTKLGRTPPAMQSPREFHEATFDRSRRKQLGPPLGLRHAVIKTEHGDVEVELFGDDAIQTVTTFIAWSKKGFYRKLTTHRVVPNFVVQGGDPRGDGSGDAGFTIPAEVSRHRYDTGYLGIADSGKDTGSCQWFITLSPQPHLDGRYTIFGKVTKGMDRVWKIDQGDTFDVKILD
jgi:HEAT repeat protein/cyclophilin family peptidyl-prolyl cis-trans isomerase